MMSYKRMGLDPAFYRRLRVNRRDVTMLEGALAASRFLGVPDFPGAAEAIKLLRLYFHSWVETSITLVLYRIREMPRQRQRERERPLGSRLRISLLDVSHLQGALNSARFKNADDDRAEFVEARRLLHSFIETQIVEPLAKTLERITRTKHG